MGQSAYQLLLGMNSLLTSAREELRVGQPADACARLDGLIAAEPGNGEALHLKGLIEAHNEAWASAAACFQLALEVSPGKIRWATDLASALAAQGDWEAAADV